MAKLVETSVVGTILVQEKSGEAPVEKPIDRAAEIVEFAPSEVFEMLLVGETPFPGGNEPRSVRVVRITETVKAPPIPIVG